MTTTTQPATITDNTGFRSLVNAWKYADIWDKFDLVYNGVREVPERLHDYTIVRSDDPAEPYGVLLKMPPAVAAPGNVQSYLGRKLLAKVRVN